MSRFVLLSAILATPAFGWTCDESKGLIEVDDIVRVSKECVADVCQYTLTAPHTLQDRAFAGFDLSKEVDGRRVISGSLSYQQMGANFYTTIVVNKGHETGVFVTANYLNFNYGCTINTTVYIDES